MEGEKPATSPARLFAERFDDFFECGVFPALALGLLFAWIWMGLTEGYPIFMSGRVDLPSVLILLGSFSAAIMAVGFFAPLQAVLQRKSLWPVSGAIMAAACMGMLYLFYAGDAWDPFAELIAIRGSMVVVGVGAAILIMPCAVGYARFRPMSGGIAFTFSIVVTFVAFFCLNAADAVVRGILFCLLPMAAGCVLVRGGDDIVDRMALQPSEKAPFARGFTSMCVSFCVFFFAIGAKCALEPVWEFAMAADTSVIGVLAVSLAFLYAMGLAPKPVGVFRALKISYSVAVMVLTISIAIAPLSLEPYSGILYNADVMVMIMVLWLLMSFVAHFNESPVGKVVGLALGLAALGLAVGWLVGTLLYQMLGHERSYPTIALACATAVFSTVGFSGNSFPHLTRGGQGAKKQAKIIEPYKPADFGLFAMQEHHLSGREREVLELMVAGYGSEAISEKLVVSYHTARTHVRNIYKKMDIHSQRELLDAFEAAKSRYEEEAEAEA